VSTYGYAASLAIVPDATAGARVIVQWDMGAAEDGKSVLIALDGRSGKTVWQTRRPVGASWASPLVTHVEQDSHAWQIITCASPLVIGYDAASGGELWRASVLGGDVAPSPAAAICGGKTCIFAAQEGITRVAIPISGASGTLSPAWKFDDEGMPDIVSPVSDGRFVWTVTSAGTLFCFDAAGGSKLWQHDFSTTFRATPSLVGSGENQELWLTETGGMTHRLAVGPAFKEIGTNALGEGVAASFAFSSALPAPRLVVRGENSLWCIGAAAVAAGAGK
jgi:outer membrane protein assembly factor BamB